MTTPTAVSEPLPGPGIKPLASLRAHPRVALATALLVLLVAAPLAWKKGAPQYHSEATVQVAPRYMKNLSDDQELVLESNAQYRQFVDQQVQAIRRYDVLEQAIADPAAHDAVQAWARPGDSARRTIERLQSTLQVQPVPNTYLVRIALEDTRPVGLSELLNAVVRAYLATTRTEQIYGVDERSAALREREQFLQQQFDRLAAERNAIARDLSITSYSDNIANPFDKLVADQRHALQDATRELLNAEAALRAFRENGDTNIVTRSVQDDVLNDPGLNALKSNLYKRQGDLVTLLSGLRPEHPGYAAARQELNDIDKTIKAQESKLESRVTKGIQARLEGTAQQARQLKEGLARNLADLEEHSAKYAALFQRAQTLTADMDMARKEIDQLRGRYNYLAMESGAPGFVRGVTTALPADKPYGTGRKRLLLLALLAAGMAGLVAPLALDMLDRRVRTVNQAQTLMGIAPAGWQIEITPATQEYASEQARRLAGALVRSHGASDARVFGFTGIKPGAGGTSMLLQVAQALHALGFRVLAVEANAFKPDPRLAGGAIGLADVLAGNASPDDAVTPATETLPARVALAGASAGAAAPTGISRLDRLSAALAHWSGQYDFVLADLPPLLSSADAELLLGRIGHVLVVLEAGQTARGEILRARRLLQALDPAAVGFVLNRVRPFASGGYLSRNLAEHATRAKAPTTVALPWSRLAWTRRAGG